MNDEAKDCREVNSRRIPSGVGKLYTGRLPAVCQISIKKALEKAPGPSIFWRPLPDLNRCRRRERAVSWARLDEGDV